MRDRSHPLGYWLSGRHIAGLLAVAACSVSASAQGHTERASLTGAAGQVFSDSDQVSVSGNGRFVAFRSAGSDLVPGDTNGVADVFVRDRWTGVVERISVSTAGDEGDAEGMEPHLSFDGRYVVFASEANNLTLEVQSGTAKDIYLRDRVARTTQLVNLSNFGAAANGDCHRPRVSSDGRFVAFEGTATNLIPGTSTSSYQVFRRDMLGVTALVSVNLSGTHSSGFSWSGGISGDGRYVSFVSNVSNLVTADTNGQTDAFWRDMLLGTTRRVSVSSAGLQGTGSTFTTSSISRDGRWVAFASNAPNLAPGEFAAGYDIFLHDILSSATHRISLTSSGSAANQNSYDPAVSDDGRFVAFQSFSTNLDSLDTDLQSDVFLRDRQLGTTRLVSRNATTSADDDSFSASISGDGDVVGFQSESTDLVPSDTNLRIDAFVRDFGRDYHPIYCAGLPSTCPCSNAGQGGAGCENSTQTGGALLRAFGRASVVADQVTLLATGLPPGSSALFFQGTLRENNGAGSPFGDGLRCAGGTVVRLATYGVVAGTAAIGYGGLAGLGGGDTTPVHMQGLVPTFGGTRMYQTWYRNAAAFCTSASHNLTNGVEIVWVP